MEQTAEMVLRYLELRIALTADGWSVRHDEASPLLATVMIPGGSTLALGRDGEAALFTVDRKKLARGSLSENGFLASLMHNCDVMIAKEFGPGALEAIEFADAITESERSDIEDAILDAVPRGREFPLPNRTVVAVAISEACDSANERLRATAIAWKAAEKVSGPLRVWNDVESLVRWNGRVATWNRKEELIPSENGNWHRIECESGRVEAARSLGHVEGMLGSYTDERRLYALRLDRPAAGVKPGSIIAVAVFENDELVSVIRNSEHVKQPGIMISKDLARLADAVDETAKKKAEAPAMGF